MNILIILFLTVASHPDLTCSQLSANTAQIQPVVATGGAADRFRELAVVSRRGSEPLFETGSEAYVVSDDLAFYVASHAQAAGDTSGATLTPWLGLRPIGDVQRSVLSASGEPAQAPAGQRGKACSWSPASSKS